MSPAVRRPSGPLDAESPQPKEGGSAAFRGAGRATSSRRRILTSRQDSEALKLITARSPRRTTGAVLLALAAGACAGTGHGVESSSVVVRAPVTRVRAANLPALRALQNAVEEGADEVARRLVTLLRARPLNDDEEATVAAFERILVGRELIDAIEFRLDLEGEPPRLWLVLVNRSGGPLTLNLPPADLEHLRVTVDAEGLEERNLAARLLDLLRSRELQDAEPVRIELGPVSVPLGSALAARDTWRLSLRSGEVLRDGMAYPAGRLPLPRRERTVVSDSLPDEPVASGELAQALACALATWAVEGNAEAVDGSLLALAVRVPEEERESTLRALLPVLASFPEATLELGARLAPALRWVARTREPGSDLRMWRGWLDAWIRREDARRWRAESQGGLDLPSGAAVPEGLRGASPRGLDLKERR